MTIIVHDITAQFMHVFIIGDRLPESTLFLGDINSLLRNIAKGICGSIQFWQEIHDVGHSEGTWAGLMVEFDVGSMCRQRHQASPVWRN